MPMLRNAARIDVWDEAERRQIQSRFVPPVFDHPSIKVSLVYD